MNDELITNEKDEVEIDKNTEKSDDLITEIKEDGKVKPILTEEQIKSKKKKRRHYSNFRNILNNLATGVSNQQLILKIAYVS